MNVWNTDLIGTDEFSKRPPRLFCGGPLCPVTLSVTRVAVLVWHHENPRMSETSFRERLHNEKELRSPGASGPTNSQLLGPGLQTVGFQCKLQWHSFCSNALYGKPDDIVLFKQNVWTNQTSRSLRDHEEPMVRPRTSDRRLSLQVWRKFVLITLYEQAILRNTSPQ